MATTIEQQLSQLQQNIPYPNYFGLKKTSPIQTRTVLILYIAVSVLTVIAAIADNKLSKEVGWMIALGFIGILFILFNTSCLVLGKCKLYAWITALGVIVPMLAYIGFLMYKLLNNRRAMRTHYREMYPTEEELENIKASY